jgi:hypothetical protein
MKTRMFLRLVAVWMVVYAGSGWGYTEGEDNNFFGIGAGSNTTGIYVYDTFIGGYAGYSNTDGEHNSFLGYQAGYSNTTGNNNSFLGTGAGYSNTTGCSNSFLGYQAGYWNTAGYNNSFIGYLAGYSNTEGYSNSFLGYEAGQYNTTGYYNNFLGDQAGRYNTTGHNNNFLGDQAGYNNTIGYYNSFLGTMAGYHNTTGRNNTCLGSVAGYSNTMGNYNSFIGSGAGYLNTEGNNNSFIGFNAGTNNYDGSDNSFLGYQAGYSNIAGSGNSFLGYQAGYSNSTGSGNVFLGYNAGFNETGSNRLYIANSSSSALIYGEFDTSIARINGRLGILKVPGASYQLDVNGAVNAGSFTGNGSGLTNLTELDPKVGALTNNRWCTSDGTHVNCNQTAPILTEVDPKVGLLNNGSWCASNGSQVNCNQAAPVTVDKVGTLTTGQWCSSLDGTHVTCTQSPPVTMDKVGSNTTNFVPRWNGSQLVSGIIEDTGSAATIDGNFRVFSPNVATYADILGRNQPAGTSIDVETSAGVSPAGPVQAINGAFLVKYTPGSPIPNNFNTFRMTARTDATMTDQINGHVAAGNFQAQHNGGGTASAVVGVIANAYLLGSGNVTNAIAVTAGNPVRSGTGVITNAYGVDIQAQKITGVTNAYGVYQSGASDVNYFAGNIGVGKTNPTNPIEASSGAYLSAGGQWISASSREQKENIKELGAEEADAALSGLKPVRYNYKNVREENHVGFIAEDVPALVATRDRKGLSPMDIVAVLTKVVQEQQKLISAHSEKISELEKALQLKGTLPAVTKESLID